MKPKHLMQAARLFFAITALSLTGCYGTAPPVGSPSERAANPWYRQRHHRPPVSLHSVDGILTPVV